MENTTEQGRLMFDEEQTVYTERESITATMKRGQQSVMHGACVYTHELVYIISYVMLFRMRDH